VDRNPRQQFPLRPDFSARARPADAFIRSACCALMAAHANDFPGAMAERHYADDRAVATLTLAMPIVVVIIIGWLVMRQ
jgi:hypothetical protein